MDFTDRPASDPRLTAEPLPRLPPGDPGVRILLGGIGVATEVPPEMTDLAEMEGPAEEFLRDITVEELISSNASSSPIAENIHRQTDRNTERDQIRDYGVERKQWTQTYGFS